MSGRPFIMGILLFLAMVLVIPTTGAEISYTFDIDASGAAWYLIEYRTLLDSPEKIDEFNDFKQIVELNTTHQTQFEKRMQDIVTRAGIATSRPMNASDFSVSVSNHDTTTGNFGVVRYTFNWGGFSQVTDSSIILGDVFFGGQHISSGDSFIIKIPEGYDVQDVDPAPDIQREYELVWMGPSTFNSGKPHIVFSEQRPPRSFWPWPVAAFVLILALGSGVLFLRRRNNKKVTKKPPVKPDTYFKKVVIEPDPPEVVKASLNYFGSDENWIISLIQEKGGGIMQSEIVSRTHFSKSKTSALLAKMSDDGVIERVKKGRENLIRLRKK